VVEGAALLVGHTRRLRLALTAGVLVGTVGLLGELAWVILSGYGPSSPVLLPKIAVLGPLAAVGAAVLGAGLARAFDEDERRMPAASLAFAGLVLLAALAYPLPRNVGEVQALIRLDRTVTKPRSRCNWSRPTPRAAPAPSRSLPGREAAG
jgi:hypothetical protein